MQETKLPQQGDFCHAEIDRGAKRIVVKVGHYTGEGFYSCVGDDMNAYHIHKSNLSPMTTIPSRFSERNFTRVAHVIGAALRSFPEMIEVDPAPLAPETYCRLLREARDGKHRFGHKHVTINEELFKELADKIGFSPGFHGEVRVGPLDRIKDKSSVPTGIIKADANPTAPQYLVDNKPFVIEQVCLLLHNRSLTPPPRFVIRNPLPADIQLYEDRFDVVFSPLAEDPTLYEIR